jgi:hypothetical protein
VCIQNELHAQIPRILLLEIMGGAMHALLFRINKEQLLPFAE